MVFWVLQVGLAPPPHIVLTASMCSFFDDPGICIVTWCCPCITYGQNTEKLGGNCALDGCVYLILMYFGCCCCVHMGFRGKMRQRYQLPEDCGPDCFATCCFSACALCQEARHLSAIPGGGMMTGGNGV